MKRFSLLAATQIAMTAISAFLRLDPNQFHFRPRSTSIVETRNIQAPSELAPTHIGAVFILGGASNKDRCWHQVAAAKGMEWLSEYVLTTLGTSRISSTRLLADTSPKRREVCQSLASKRRTGSARKKRSQSKHSESPPPDHTTYDRNIGKKPRTQYGAFT
jgi:hypothetical protein